MWMCSEINKINISQSYIIKSTKILVISRQHHSLMKCCPPVFQNSDGLSEFLAWFSDYGAGCCPH